MNRVAAQLRAKLEDKGDTATRSQRVPHADPRKEEDAAYRRAYGTNGKAPYGRPLRAAFYQFLPESPRGQYVSHEAAKQYVAEIQRVLDTEQWTRDERTRLKALKRIWSRRAEGRDARFEAMGVQGGVTNKHRPKTTRDIIIAIRDAIEASGGGRVVSDKKFVVDVKWPLGKPVGV
jgi:hypothetical protein